MIVHESSGVEELGSEAGVVFSCVALVWMSASVANQYSFQVDLFVWRYLVMCEDFICQTRDVNACVTLSSNIEVASFVL